MLQFTKGGSNFDRLYGTFLKLCPFLQLIILFFQPTPLFQLVRIARMGRPGCFTNDLMHSQIVNHDDNEDDNDDDDANNDYDHDVMMMMMYR